MIDTATSGDPASAITRALELESEGSYADAIELLTEQNRREASVESSVSSCG